MPPVIRFHDATLGYGRRPAIHHLDGALRAGSLTAIVGPNGAGKSTLMKGIVGALPPLSGRISVEGGARRIAYLPQAAEIDRSFPISVSDLVSLGAWTRAGAFGRVAHGHDIADALEAVGLGGFAGRAIGTLSGGQLQRALFARVLLQDARVILLDEPFTAIDAATTADLLGLVRRWHGEERTVVAVLHDLDTVRECFPETLLVAREPIAWGTTADSLSPANLARARAMMEAPSPHASACRRAA